MVSTPWLAIIRPGVRRPLYGRSRMPPWRFVSASLARATSVRRTRARPRPFPAWTIRRRPRAQPRACERLAGTYGAAGFEYARRLPAIPDGRRRHRQPIRSSMRSRASAPSSAGSTSSSKSQSMSRPQRADSLIAAAERADVRLGVFFQDRVQPDIVAPARLRRGGRLGRPLLASARVKWYRPPEYYGQSHWRGTWALDGGGALMNQGIHTVDLLQWVLGPCGGACEDEAPRSTRSKSRTRRRVAGVQERRARDVRGDDRRLPGYKRRVEFTGSEGTLVLEHDRLVRPTCASPPTTCSPSAAADTNQSASHRSSRMRAAISG